MEVLKPLGLALFVAVDNWEPELKRVGLAAGAIAHIVSELYDNC